MTTPLDPNELASAIVDGELSVDETARAMADADVAARVQEIREVQAAIRQVPPYSELHREAALQAAVTSSVEEPRSSTASGRHLPWLAVAAAVLFLVATVGFVLQRGNEDGDLTAAETADDLSAADRDTSADGGPSLEAPEASPDDALSFDAEPEADQPGEVPHLGAFGATPELVAAVLDGHREGRMQGPADDGFDAGEAKGHACPQRTVAGDPHRGSSEFAATATLDGRPVWVHLYPGPDDQLRLVATDTTCTDLIDQLLDM